MLNAIEDDSSTELNRLIAESWNKNLHIRAEDIERKTDYTYHEVILPWVLNEILCRTPDNSSILDIGCGCGYLTNKIYESGRHNIVGIDLSDTSIKYAAAKYPHILFKNQDLYELNAHNCYNICLAVMLLNNIPDINKFFETIFQALTPNGLLICCMPHPCFWPHKHISDPRFQYTEASRFFLPFSTKGRKDYQSPVPYFHRSLESYYDSIQSSGLTIIDFCEHIEKENDKTPDILSFVLRKGSSTND